MWSLQPYQGYTVPTIQYTPAPLPTPPDNEALINYRSFIRNNVNISIEDLKSPNLGQPKPPRRPPNRRLLARIQTLKHVEQCQSRKLERLRVKKRHAKRNRLPTTTVSVIECEENKIANQWRVIKVQLENLEKLLEAEQPFWETSGDGSTIGALDLMISSSSGEEEAVMTKASTPEKLTLEETPVDQEDVTTLSQSADPSSMSTGSTSSRSSRSPHTAPQASEGQETTAQIPEAPSPTKRKEDKAPEKRWTSQANDRGAETSRSARSTPKQDRKKDLNQQVQEEKVSWRNVAFPRLRKKRDSTKLETKTPAKSEVIKKIDWTDVTRMKFEAEYCKRTSNLTPALGGEASDTVSDDTENPNLNEPDEIPEPNVPVRPKPCARFSRSSFFYERTVTGKKQNPNSSRTARQWSRPRRVGDSSQNGNLRSKGGGARQADKSKTQGPLGVGRRNSNPSSRTPSYSGSGKQPQRERLRSGVQGGRTPPYRNTQASSIRNVQSRRFPETRTSVSKPVGRPRESPNRQQLQIARKRPLQTQSAPRRGRNPPNDGRPRSQSRGGGGRRKPPISENRPLKVTEEEKLVPPPPPPLCQDDMKLKEDQLRDDELLARRLCQDEILARQIQREEFVARFQSLKLFSNSHLNQLADMCMMTSDSMQVEDEKEALMPPVDIEIKQNGSKNLSPQKVHPSKARSRNWSVPGSSKRENAQQYD